MDSSTASFFSLGGALRATGPDARSFLQGQSTNDLSKLQPGEVSYGLFLDRKGKIVADAHFVCRSDESFELFSLQCSSSTLFDRLDPYLVMDEVELQPQAEARVGVALWSAAAPAFLREAGMEDLGGDRVMEKGGVTAFWATRGTRRFLLAISGSSSDAELARVARAALTASGGITLSDDDLALEAALRIEPRVGIEIRLGADLPQECGLVERAVSFNKGCYLGQEVMARLKTLGRVRKAFATVEIDTAETIETPAPLMDDQGKRWGELRSFAVAGGLARGLALLSLEAPEQLLLPSGCVARKIIAESCI